MLIGEEDVAVVAEDEVGNRRNHAVAVRARDKKDGRVVHKRLLIQPVSPVIPRCTSALPVVKICSTAGSTGLPRGKLNYFFSAFAISRAALAPEPPVSPVPGCVPLPHKYRCSIGVL